MFKKTVLSLMFGVLLLGLGALTAFAASNEIKDSVGWDVFTGSGYRYGPSIMINTDNSIDMWMAGPGSGGAWDFIYYKHSTDGGLTWGTEAPALAPTPGSRDAFSTCDPGVIKIGSYYYMGYTSTQDASGSNNQLYVARSTTPNGGFEKWNGSGWGGTPNNPQPFITYTGPSTAFGIGEPSFVEKDGTIYIYYTYLDGTVYQTRVATASASDPNWPGAITYRGVAVNREAGGGAGGSGSSLVEDSTDIKYVDSIGKFIGVAEGRRLMNESYTVAYESTDGITFVPSVFVNNDKQNYSHNIGISGTTNGHLDTTKNNFVAFAYGPNWGQWHLHLSPIVLIAQPVGVTYQSQVQNIGWQSWVQENRLSGTVGQALRDEAFKIQLTNPLAGMNITYQALVQNIGWQTAVLNGAIAGTVGQSLRIEAIKIVLSGTVPAGYHVKYRVQQENVGWSNWYVDNQQAGVTGQSLRIEALQLFVYKD
jgi:hypothetical protein